MRHIYVLTAILTISACVSAQQKTDRSSTAPTPVKSSTPHHESVPQLPTEPSQQNRYTNEQRQQGTLVDVSFAPAIARFLEEQTKQSNETKETLYKISSALSQFAIAQEKLSDTIEKNISRPKQQSSAPARVVPGYKYSVQTVDGQRWYSDDINEIRYTEWYYNRRAKGIPKGAEPFDPPARIIDPDRTNQKTNGSIRRNVRRVGDIYVNDQSTSTVPSQDGKAVQEYAAPAPQVQTPGQQTYAYPYSPTPYAQAPYAAAAPGSSCYSSSAYQANSYGTYAMQPAVVYGGGYGGQIYGSQAYGGQSYGNSFIGGHDMYNGGYGDGIGGGAGAGLHVNTFSSRQGLLGRLFGGEPNIRSRSFSIGGGTFGGLGRGTFGGGCPGGVCY